MATRQFIPRPLALRGASRVCRAHWRHRALEPSPSTMTGRRHASTPARGGGLSEEFRRRQAAQQKATPVIPQPDKYRPPSHGKTAPNRSRDLANRVYGPPISAEDKKRMATKKYPNMMSPEGSFSHWFINTKSIHVWISLGILVSLAGSAWWLDFRSKTVYFELVPSSKDFLHHPYSSFTRFIEVYRMHYEQTSQQYTQQRLKKAEDIEKRKQYRQERQREAEERGEEWVEDTRYYVGEDGIRRRRVKRWFGIWE